jgi:hypothetical protein
MSIQPILKTSPPTIDVESFITLLSKSYLNVPLTTAFITEIDSASGPQTRSSDHPSAPTSSRLHQHFSLGIPLACKSNVILSHSPDFTAAALIEPPDFVGIPPSQARRNPGPILSEYRSTIRALKNKYLALPDTGPRSWDQPAAPSQSSGGPSEDPYPSDFNKDIDYETRPFYHLAMVGRDPDVDRSEGEKTIDACVAPFLERAKKEGLPVWTEASTQSKKAENERWGFRVAEEAVIGKGRIDGDGKPSEGGDGVKVWAMIYDEHLK